MNTQMMDGRMDYGIIDRWGQMDGWMTDAWLMGD